MTHPKRGSKISLAWPRFQKPPFFFFIQSCASLHSFPTNPEGSLSVQFQVNQGVKKKIFLVCFIFREAFLKLKSQALPPVQPSVTVIDSLPFLILITDCIIFDLLNIYPLFFMVCVCISVIHLEDSWFTYHDKTLPTASHFGLEHISLWEGVERRVHQRHRFPTHSSSFFESDMGRHDCLTLPSHCYNWGKVLVYIQFQKRRKTAQS